MKLFMMFAACSLVVLTQVVWAQEKSTQRTVKETLICQLDPAPVRDSMVVSSDLRRVAFYVKIGNKYSMILDGKSVGQFDGLGTYGFSPDNKRFAYGGKVGKKWVVILDGQESKQYDGVGGFIFSPDSKHFAFGAKIDKKELWLPMARRILHTTKLAA
ncbi:MAG: hypothetical protein AABN33_29900 [Acidobacteriota bacterium]